MTVLDRLKLSLLVGLGIVLVAAGMAGNRRDVGILETGLWAALVFTGLLNCLPALEIIQHATERLSGVDLDADGSVGPHAEPVAQPEPVLVFGRRETPATFDAARFGDFVRACAINTTERSLRDAGYTGEEIDAWRKLLIKAGYGMAVNGDGSLGNGWKLLTSPTNILAGMFPVSPTRALGA